MAQFCFSMMWLTWVSQAPDKNSWAECSKVGRAVISRQRGASYLSMENRAGVNRDDQSEFNTMIQLGRFKSRLELKGDAGSYFSLKKHPFRFICVYLCLRM